MRTPDTAPRRLAVAYLVLALATAPLEVVAGAGGWTGLWAISPALGFGLLAAAGMRWLPLVIITELLRVALPDLILGGGLPGDALLVTAVTLTSYAVGALLLRRLARRAPRFRTVSALYWFLLVALMAPLPTAAATIIIEAIGGPEIGELLERARVIWSAGVSGLLATVPAILVVVTPLLEGRRIRLFERGRTEAAYPVLPPFAEIAAQVFSLGVAIFMVFGLDEAEGATLLFFLFPPLIWIAFAYGVRLASLSLTLTLVASTIAAELTGLTVDQLPVFPLALLVATASTLTFGTLVTLQRRAERARLEQEESFRRLAEAAFEGILIHERGRVIQVNARLAEMVGLTQDDILGGEVLSFVADDHRGLVGDKIRSEFEGSYEADLVRTDGHRFPVEISGKTYSQGDRRIRVAAIRDITERRISEEALRESETRFRTLTEQAPDGVMVMDVRGGIVSANSRVRELLGYDDAELGDRALGDLLHPSEVQDLSAQIAILRSGRPLTIVRRMVKKNTARIHVEISAKKVGEDRIQAILRDVTERKLIEEALRESEGRYRALFKHMLSGFALHEILLDDGGHPIDYLFHEINPAFEEMTGLKRTRVLGKRVTEVLPGIDSGDVGWIETYARVALTGESVRFEQHSKELDRWYLVYAYSPQKRYFVTLFHDITEEKRAEDERRQLEARIQHGQKMESLGVLAGGVAHDFNNLLVGVLANAGLARKHLPDGSPAASPLVQIERAAQRAADLTEQMLAYSGKGQFQVTGVDLSSLVREMSELLQTVLSPKARLVTELPEGLPTIRADATQIRQVVMNLLTNASDALEGDAGDICLRTGISDADADYLATTWPGDDLSPGPYVWVEVRDTGGGMDEETIRRMFDPFFTTKFTGRGLGLAAVLGIVRGHDGTLRVESSPGGGTTFRVLFPKGDDDVRIPAPTPRKTETVAPWGTILVVDDDDTVRLAAREILDYEGYDVIEAEDGVDALGVYDANAKIIDAVVLDLTMPRMDGVETFKELRSRRDDLPILLSSGYGESAVDRLPSRSRARYLRKPYTPSELLDAVAKVLEDGPDQTER
jgi:two-component system, cell cycle sensor histidine kinase and response regulator CckA